MVDNDGNTYVTGSFSGTASFGNFQLTTTNPSDMFLARYDSAGNCLGVKNFGHASGNCLATDSNGDVVVAGTFNNTVTIGSNTLTSYGGRLEMNDGTIKVELEAQAKGVYSITLGNGKRVFSGKMVIE
ncbi:MAG: hypothetical protein IPP71_18320 [Bacteroidetes bacterium]|nr:hypothetical protein [Bacteroidota bacterium]